MRIFTSGVAVLGLVFLAILSGSASFADDVKKIRPPKSKHKLSISYRPDSRQTFATKYKVRLGLLPIRDQRVMKFYRETDDFFIDQIVEAINNSLYSELKFSQLFKSVKKLSDKQPLKLEKKALANYAASKKVDLVFVMDLVKFNLLREKMVSDKKGVDYQIIVAFEFVGQVIEPQSGKVIWADHIRRDVRSLNTTGKVLPTEYTQNAIEALQAGFGDMKQLINSTGLEIVR